MGYTIRQGLRIGVSAYRGPYLYRESPYFFPGESSPRDLPATAVGADVEWARGHWNMYGEWQRFEMTYHAIPTFREDAGYFEAKRVLHPRWYIAARAGYAHGSYKSGGETYEASVGFRPDSFQLIKVGYSVQHNRDAGDFLPGARLAARHFAPSSTVISLALGLPLRVALAPLKPAIFSRISGGNGARLRRMQDPGTHLNIRRSPPGSFCSR